MSHLTLRERELVSLGAAMGSNCILCVEYHILDAKNAGLTDSEISEAIVVADKTRQAPARKTLAAAMAILPGLRHTAPAAQCDVSSMGPRAGESCCG